ncbi:MAG: methyl-accepting chemotaxis protein [Desulfuromonadaceae bacterium]|nr:methyl-accepting chemotaxis protein [Desulfuromonadaceae bacterium]MDD5106853.1 methyl-accepting chemotaxis protein [Desulfuromonadaceae bacterium]
MWRNWKIGTRISLGFILMLILLGMVGYTGYSSLLTVMDRSDKSDQMQMIVKNMLEARRHEKNLIIRKEADYREKTLKATAEMKRLALATKERFKQTDNKKLMDSVLVATGSYEDAFRRLAELVLANGAPTPEQADLDKKMVAAARAAQETCEIAVKDQKGEMATAFSSALHTIEILSGLTILFSILFAVLITLSISVPLGKLVKTANTLADGDFTVDVAVNSGDEVGQLAENLKEMSEKLCSLITQVSGISANSAVFAHGLHSGAERIAAGVVDVAAQATGIATAGEEMSATSGNIAQNCQMASEGAQRAAESAESGAAVVEATVMIMSKIAENVQHSARTVESLGERSDQIGDIIGTIEDIADQTNLLALNAAIEAARAGEQGRGFAVVADEVRALAERTTRATREIGEMIKAIQVETKGAVAAMEQGVHQVENGTIEAAKSGEALRDILAQINDVAMQISQIATAAEEQTATTAEISGNMHQITSILQETAREANSAATSTSRMNIHNEETMACFGRFKLNESVPLALSKAKSAHMIFIGKVKSHLDGTARVDADKLPTHLTCAFGKWYQDRGHQSCGHSGHFQEIDAPHARVHELGKQTIAAFNSGDRQKADALCAEMVSNSETLMENLDKLAIDCQ